MSQSTKHLQFRTQHTRSTILDEAEKRRRRTTWKHWRRYGLKGDALEKRTHLQLARVRKWAAELNFDLEGLA